MEDISTFVKCHGLIKDDIIKELSPIKLDNRFYAFTNKEQNQWCCLLWNDEQTIIFYYGNETSIELWHTGKKIYHKKYGSVFEPSLFSACLELYTIQDSFVGSIYESFMNL
jgi:hypothetical protein